MNKFSSKYIIDTAENVRFLQEMRENLLKFGMRFPSEGGSSYYLGDDGTPWTDRPRETWITSRMAHVYSLGTLIRSAGDIMALPKDAMASGSDSTESIQSSSASDTLSSSASDTPSAFAPDACTSECTPGISILRKLAEAAIRGLTGELHDDINGGWYAGITAEGEILPGKQCYAHAFVILAACSAVLAGITGGKELLQDALNIYDRYFWDEDEGLALDSWDTDFTQPDGYRGLNANMHTVEAFMAVWDVTGDSTCLVRAGRIIRRVVSWAEHNEWRIPEHFTSDWDPDFEYNSDHPDDPFKPYGATPGHGIEWARLILQWAEADTSISSENKSEYQSAAKSLYDRAVQDAWNCDGAPGFVYTTDWQGRPVVHDRMHWTLAEAINTSAVLYRVTGSGKYSQDYSEYMKYLDETVLDHENGSWYHQMDSTGRVLGSVWPGKSDIYHALQSALIPYNLRVGISIAASISRDPEFQGEEQ